MSFVSTRNEQAPGDTPGRFVARPLEPLRYDRVFVWIAAIAIGAGLLLRAIAYARSPLSFDETFTLVIATQPTFAGFFEWVLNELGGPVYYGLAFVWDKLFGAATLSIRLPSLILSLAAPLYVLRCRIGTPQVRLLWAALLAVWPEGVAQAGLARSYALLILLMAVQAVAFAKLIDRTDRRRAAIWVAWSSLAILTHYHAALISLLQGLLLLGFRRRLALRCWPAGLILLPVATWGGAQAASLLAYATPGANWYELIDPADILSLPLVALGLVIAVECISSRTASPDHGEPIGEAAVKDMPDQRLGIALVVASAVLSLVALYAAGMLVPSYTDRYVIPFMPGAMLGIACWLAAVATRRSRLLSGLTAALLGIAPLFASVRHFVIDPTTSQTQFNVEAASEWIGQRGGSDRLVFLWDNLTASGSSTLHLAQFGAYYLRRAGYRPEVIIPRGTGPATDPNAFLVRMAGDARLPAIIWVSDTATPGTLAKRFPPNVAARNPGWECRLFGQANLRIDVCVKRQPRLGPDRRPA